ncbi:hypothetical protein E9549_17610 [Blastococcus sp. MG754426]|uniref:hypothetical protein n=1 Tax=unclassified Blastococcus TaxID=2619396 RepID=UPI001EF0D072|nr:MULTISPECIES: hypothetical protein [unclassified Blastococcus]MCF6509205.1 hypothetical protein [Blastococcus sp. MG754426]MCF6513773.1 hypothetical protein [Blastococcus sp. MG754427]MCF6736315.1 hypothetical protein [Blastococcus sp. KM273129]
MPAREDCPGSDHRPPVDGGACDCGMVTRIPVGAPAAGPVDVRTVLARCLDEAAGGVEASSAPAVEQRVDRLLAALADAGFAVTPEPGLSRPA